MQASVSKVGRVFAAMLLVTACSQSVTTPNESFVLTLRAPAAVVAGEAVVFELDIQNVSERQQHLGFNPEQSFIPQVRDQGGNVVWMPRDGRVELPQRHPPIAFAPGERVTLREVWNQRNLLGESVAAGTYRVQAALLGDDATVEVPAVTITISAK